MGVAGRDDLTISDGGHPGRGHEDPSTARHLDDEVDDAGTTGGGTGDNHIAHSPDLVLDSRGGLRGRSARPRLPAPDGGPGEVSPPRVVESFVASLAVDAAHTLNVFSRVQDEISN